MGANMARRLIRKGHTRAVFNRSPQAVIRIFQDLPATSPTLVKDAGPLRLRSMKQYRPQFSRRRFMSDSVLGARRTLPTSSVRDAVRIRWTSGEVRRQIQSRLRRLRRKSSRPGFVRTFDEVVAAIKASIGN